MTPTSSPRSSPAAPSLLPTWGTTRSLTTHPTFGEMYVLPTKQSYIPNVGMLQSGAAPFTMKHVLTVVNAITIKVPLAVLAAPFGVNERETLELLMDNVYPVANMAFMGTKAKIYTRNYENDDYSQDVLIDTPNQFTVDVLARSATWACASRSRPSAASLAAPPSPPSTPSRARASST